MPYIKEESRPKLDRIVEQLPEELKAGELNYFITKTLLATKPQSYTDYNALVGVLECVKLEFYRRAISTYEDGKMVENGDVYGSIE